MSRTCSVPACSRDHYGRGWCKMHYKRWAKHGDVFPAMPPRQGPVSDRLWAKVDKTGGCWLWTGFQDEGGYGRIYAAGRSVAVHRVAYELLVGPIPEGLVIDHLCRVRNCVNPDHLEPVTNAENIRRGMAPSALACRLQRCQHGHEFTPENTYWTPNGRRQCRVCILRRSAETAARRSGTREGVTRSPSPARTGRSASSPLVGRGVPHGMTASRPTNPPRGPRRLAGRSEPTAPSFVVRAVAGSLPAPVST